VSGYIYIMRAGPYFKIGYTESWPTGRLQQIQISNPEPVYLIGVTAGTMQEEKRLHETYAAKRSHGEWFALSNHDVNTILVRGVRIPIQPPRPGRRVYAPPRRRTSPPETMREDVLSLLAAGRGMSSSQAAAALGVSKTTASNI
jgi:Meiotically Up-regulated Gene 113 (MUG113) protein